VKYEIKIFITINTFFIYIDVYTNRCKGRHLKREGLPPPSFKSSGGTPPDLDNVRPAGRYKEGRPPKFKQPPKSSLPPGAIAPPIGRGYPPETTPPIGSGQPPVMPMNR
jgi:hypothetical protein